MQEKKINQLTGDVTHLMVAEYRLPTRVASHIGYCVILKTVTNCTRKGKADASIVGLAYW